MDQTAGPVRYISTDESSALADKFPDEFLRFIETLKPVRDTMWFRELVPLPSLSASILVLELVEVIYTRTQNCGSCTEKTQQKEVSGPRKPCVLLLALI